MDRGGANIYEGGLFGLRPRQLGWSSATPVINSTLVSQCQRDGVEISDVVSKMNARGQRLSSPLESRCGCLSTRLFIRRVSLSWSLFHKDKRIDASRLPTINPYPSAKILRRPRFRFTFPFWHLPNFSLTIFLARSALNDRIQLRGNARTIVSAFDRPASDRFD